MFAIAPAAGSEEDYLHRAVAHSDLVINVGHDVVEKPPFFMQLQGAKLIHLNVSSAVVDAVYFPQLEVVGDIADSLSRLTRRLGGPVACHDMGAGLPSAMEVAYTHSGAW